MRTEPLAPPPGHRRLRGRKEQFASDNTAGACPEAAEAFSSANIGFSPSYGTDTLTKKACDMLRGVFDSDAEIYFVFNGTAANSLSLASLSLPFESVVCSDCSHIETDECGAPEFFSGGSKLLTAQSFQGKLTVAGLAATADRRSDIHYPRPAVASVTQSTELGTVYSVTELAEIILAANTRDMRVHMDGARLASAVAATGAAPALLTSGVDALCLGGAKAGIPVGEAVVFFNRKAGADFARRCKQSGQLASKMRFLSAPWISILEDDVWLRRAAHANAMAARLAAAVSIPGGASIAVPVEANAVFLSLSDSAVERLRKRGWSFHTFIGGAARFMCSWATTADAVDELATDILMSCSEGV